MIRSTVFLVLLSLAILLSGQVKESAPEGMVLIPEGTFIMGSDINPNADCAPAKAVKMNAFFMDIYEVTNKQYDEFCRATGRKYPEFWDMDIYKSGMKYPNSPVVGVSHFEAQLYAEWAGKRLPTESEWEYAGRGGLENMRYPNGNEISSAVARINDSTLPKGPVEVGSFEPNGYGLFDMAGNAWEWTDDWYCEGYFTEYENSNPKGPGTGKFRVLRGGGWHSGPGCVTVYGRNALPPNWVDFAGGFRCAMDID